MVTDGREKDKPLTKPVEISGRVGVSQEAVPTPEVLKGGETAGESPEAGSVLQTESVDAMVAPAPVVSVPVNVVPKKVDRLAKEIEGILSEDLTDIYLSMSPDKQEEFKTKGEETASKVRELVRAAKVNAKKIFQLIRDWMKIIPGVNRFFLEQEAKIKTDKVLLVSEEEKKRNEIV